MLKVKGVPLMYLPIFYYPIEEDDRSTGFLMPTYGTSTLRGQSLTNAFFWAINRSQDATFSHDWFAKAGQQFGGEYRYVLAPGSSGTLRTSMFNQKATAPANGGTATESARSYRIDGGMTQNLGGGLRARANANYFSNGDTERLYQQDVSRATQSTRSFGGNISGAWREYVLSGTMDRIDYFNASGTTSDITTSGGLPRVNFSRGERPIGKAPIYFGVNTEYVSILRRQTRNDVTVSDQGLNRFEINPTVRIPFTRVPVLHRQLDGRLARHLLEREPGRRAAGAGVAEAAVLRLQQRASPARRSCASSARRTRKFKHVIEPNFSLKRITDFDVADQIVALESSDFERPNYTRVGYGLTNRLYAKKETSREVLAVSISQSYYTDETAAQTDGQYQTGFNTRPPEQVLAGRAASSAARRTIASRPTSAPSGTTPRAPSSRSAPTAASTPPTSRRRAAGRSRRTCRATSRSCRRRRRTTSTPSVTLRTTANRLGGTYSFNYDMLADRFLQQRYFAYYNAQCCGVLVEYQTYNIIGLTVPQDRRFNVSFTLAGIGTFSNFLGAFGGQTGR